MRPLVEQLHRLRQLRRRELEGLGVGNLLDRGYRRLPRPGGEGGADPETLRHDQDRALAPRQQLPKAGYVAADSPGAGLASAGDFVLRAVRPCPGAVVVEQAALELAEADVVELGDDEALDVPAGQRDVGRLT